ncbi:hypothetical protein DTL21_02230 [Bremerella cremea]|uniref:Uncharacterized protein n=1 Tax=Blastopirellula marina TaxID=124 RepID=A0A2S8G588_9BACT|nr:hypothetical protein C5Y83_02230 [Blastopirellula marina]RCS51050.1 hypothetical protein DTL21_02230 [Bremerella cremea]
MLVMLFRIEGMHYFDGRSSWLTTKFELEVMIVLSTTGAVCGRTLVDMNTIASIQTTHTTANHTVNDHCDDCYQCCRSPRHSDEFRQKRYDWFQRTYRRLTNRV